MKKFTILYKDHLGRNNSAERYGKDAGEAETKFNQLYPDCRVISIS